MAYRYGMIWVTLGCIALKNNLILGVSQNEVSPKHGTLLGEQIWSAT